MKLRLLPVLISVIVTSAVLFGGWFVYKGVAMENPLSDILEQSKGIEDAKIQFKKDVLSLRLTLAPDASLREIVQHIRQEGEQVIGQRMLDVQVTNAPSPDLDAWWSSVLFEVAQAMDTKQYAKIPEAVQAKAGQLEGLTFDTEMDDTNVYVRLTQGEHSKFIILPRIPAMMGVWSHE